MPFFPTAYKHYLSLPLCLPNVKFVKTCRIFSLIFSSEFSGIDSDKIISFSIPVELCSSLFSFINNVCLMIHNFYSIITCFISPDTYLTDISYFLTLFISYFIFTNLLSFLFLKSCKCSLK